MLALEAKLAFKCRILLRFFISVWECHEIIVDNLTILEKVRVAITAGMCHCPKHIAKTAMARSHSGITLKTVLYVI
jgi:hypothetical protein